LGSDSSPAIAIAGLTHRFGRNPPALTNVAMTVPTGAIYGFLGPNGAGKTTTLRLMLGLLRRQSGQIHVFGQALEENRGAVLSRIGSSIEVPSIYGSLTATENLEVWRLAFGCDHSRIPAVLELVGLSETGRKRADQFSLGMKQRLAIAVALLHVPRLLVLDEPTNGLDPHGIIEVRKLLRKLNHELAITILVSSHLLSEVEKLVTHLGVINRGRMAFEGTMAELAGRRLADTGETKDLEAIFLDLIGLDPVDA